MPPKCYYLWAWARLSHSQYNLSACRCIKTRDFWIEKRGRFNAWDQLRAGSSRNLIARSWRRHEGPWNIHFSNSWVERICCNQTQKNMHRNTDTCTHRNPHCLEPRCLFWKALRGEKVSWSNVRRDQEGQWELSLKKKDLPVLPTPKTKNTRAKV